MITRTPSAPDTHTAQVSLRGRRHRQRRGDSAHPLRTGLVTAITMIVAVVVVIVGGMPGGPQLHWPWNTQLTLHARLSDSLALAPHASVQVAGVKVGEVESVTADPSGSGALVTFSITNPTAADLRSDAVLLLRPHGLFGPKYIDLQPGSAPTTLNDGATIDLHHTVQPVSLDNVLAALQAPEQVNLRTLIVELGAASQDRGADVNRLLLSAAQTTHDLEAPLQALAADHAQLDDLIVKSEAFNAYFSQVPLDQLVANSDTTLQAVADNSSHLQSLLVHANSSLAHLAADLNGQTGNLRSVIEQLPGTIQALDTFNSNLALFANNLTGKDATVSNDTNVTSGIIAAIDNPASAFSSFDCAVKQDPCPAADRRYYLRVQVFNLAGSGSASSSALSLCSLPILTLPSSPVVNCAHQTASDPGSGGPAPSGGVDLANFSSLVGD